jgi:hypothetical protein
MAIIASKLKVCASFRVGIGTENPQGCVGTEQTEDLQCIARP